jgi:hypothetical protein
VSSYVRHALEVEVDQQQRRRFLHAIRLYGIVIGTSSNLSATISSFLLFASVD